MSDLLKEAIADAKTVRETAIANAKMALEEAFTPHLKSMLSAKLAEDEYEDEEDEMEVPAEEGGYDEEEMEMGAEEVPEVPAEEVPEEEPEMEEEGVIEINGVKYAPVVAEEEGENPFAKDDEEEEDQELDLESVIKELESEIEESDNPYDGNDQHDDMKPVKETKDDVDEAKDEVDEAEDKDIKEENGDDEDDDDEKKVDEQSPSSGIGTGDNVQPKGGTAADEEDPEHGKTGFQESYDAIKAELKEHKEAVTFLREKLHEVNILNAKLLYTNRLFKEFVLSNDQKMKIVETFDRAQTTREIKLVYSTLAESFKGGTVKKTRVQESASHKTGTTKPTKKIITEESEVASRFKKLAGII